MVHYSAMSSRRPIIGITTYVAQARWGAWDQPAALTPLGYVDATLAAGGRPILVPPARDSVAEALALLDALVFVGGPDLDPALYGAEREPQTTDVRPERDAAELALMRGAIARRIPMLGICRGMQLLNVVFGGTLHQHLPAVVGHDGHRTTPGAFDLHDVHTTPGSRTARVLGERVSVASGHHQGVDRVGEGLLVSARADDDSVEALELPGEHHLVGVLWHPEATSSDNRLFEELVRVAAKR